MILSFELGCLRTRWSEFLVPYLHVARCYHDSTIKLGPSCVSGLTEDSELVEHHDAAVGHPEAVPCGRSGAVRVRQR